MSTLESDEYWHAWLVLSLNSKLSWPQQIALMVSIKNCEKILLVSYMLIKVVHIDKLSDDL